MDTTESQINSTPQKRAATSKEPSPQKDQDNSPSGMWTISFYVRTISARTRILSEYDWCECEKARMLCV